MEVLQDIQKGQIVGECLTGVFETKMPTLIDVSNEAVSKAMTAYTNHGKTLTAKQNSGRNQN
jgi:hypothetical protein